MSNSLLQEKSPYLLQHAENPVEWYPWGEEAFNRSKKEDKPIFLSIGYSTCHWCHVMERESFEVEEIASLMNSNFINIKVDREERPDLDKYYMNVCQALTGSGGWPLTIIMTPDKKSFFAATYIPPETSYGRLGMKELIPQISKIWQEDRDKIDNSIKEIMDHLEKQTAFKMPIQVREDNFPKAFLQFTKNYDIENGGFGLKPKFPSAHNLMYLLRHYKSYSEPEALKMVELTLKKMSWGGIFDQVGYGFHRYATDSQWKLPHFEKMLYDQALLTIAYAEAYQITGNELYKEVPQKIITYVMRDMTSPEGGFYSAEDADSEGEEGRYYVFSIAELEEILTPEQKEFVIVKFNFQEKGNFLDEASGQYTGKNIFHLTEELTSSEQKLWEEIRSVLFAYRSLRIPPLKDDKILTDWNSLMIAALAKAGRILKRPEYIEAAEKAVEFINKYMIDNNVLYHRWRNGDRKVVGNLDDHAFLIWGLLELYESTFKSEYLLQAIELADMVISEFRDKRKGGYFFTKESATELHMRTRELYDGAYPSGNSIMFQNLNRLERYTAEKKYSSEIKSFLRGFSVEIHKAPMAFSFFLVGLDLYFHPGMDIVYTADKKEDLQPFREIVDQKFLPGTVQIFLKTNDQILEENISWLSNYRSTETGLKIYICKDRKCEAPVADLEKFIEIIK